MAQVEAGSTAQTSHKPVFILDTGPLSVLCGFPLRGNPYIETVLEYTQIAVSDAVRSEALAPTKRGKIYLTLTPFLKSGQVISLPVPDYPTIVDISYSKDLGSGERGSIKVALATGFPVVIDDKNAFLSACRFGLRPLIFQDFVVRLARDYGMPVPTAVEIAKTTARQFPAMFLAHTLELLSSIE